MLTIRGTNSRENSTATPVSHHEVKIGSERSFGVVFAVVFTLIGLWPVVFGAGTVRLWAVVIAVAFLTVAVSRPKLLKPLNHAWFKLGMLLGRIVSPFVMLLVFLIAVTPTAFVMRLLGKDPLRLKKTSDGKNSFWIDRTGEDHKMGTMKNQF